MLLNLVQQASDGAHHVGELSPGECPRYEHRYNAREDLQPDLLDPQHTCHLLIYLKEEHAHLRVILSSADLVKGLEYLVLHSLLVYCTDDLVEDL
jgi:hypothetical protein